MLSIDINSSNQIVSASTDNVLCFWNAYSGTESKSYTVPEYIGDKYKEMHIIYIKFVFDHLKDILLIVFNDGSCYLFDTQSEKFLQFGHKNYLYG